MIYIGIDPGKSGAIAFLDGWDAWTVGLDSTDHDLFEAVREPGEAFAVIERVSSSPQMGVKSAFTFGESFGKLQMLLACAGIPYEFVTPAKWQGAMKCRTKGDKNVTKAAAQRLFPGLKVTHRNADALLLAEYARSQRSGGRNAKDH